MARQKKETDDDIFSTLANETGGEVVGEGEKESKYFIDTGNLAINYCCSGRFINGGVPGGRLTEIYGPSASSKSLLGTNLLFGCQKLGGVPILIDSENAINKDFIKKASHADLNKIVRYTPETLEKCFHVMYRAIEHIRSNKKYADKPIVIVYDSISVSPCSREFREVDLPEGYTKEQFKKIVGANEQPGERAKICSKELRKLNTVMEENNVSVVIMNQIREKIGIMYGCFHYSSRVMLADGSTMKIGKIVNQKIPVEVLSYNTKTGVVEPKKVIAWHNNGNLQEGQKFLQFTATKPWGNGVSQFGATPNHMMFVWEDDKIIEKPAGEIKIGDTLAQVQPKYLTQEQEQVVIGSILGDGSLRTGKKNYSATQLRINHGLKQAEYCLWKESILSPWVGYSYSEERRVGFDTIPMPELNKFGFRKSKYKWGQENRDCVIPQIAFEKIGLLALAIWYLDDGTYGGNYAKWGKGKARLCCVKFKNMKNMLPIFEKKFGLKAKIDKKGFIFDAENTYKLHSMIAQFVPDSMQYKIHPDFHGKFNYEIQEVDEDSVLYDVAKSMVLAIHEKPATKSKVKFDLAIEDNHTYVVDGAIVHNSPETTAGGGNALPFYASLRFRTQTQKKIEQKVPGLAKKKSIGINIKISNKKNRNVRPFIEIENIPLFFEKGMNPLGGLLGALLDAERIIASGAGNFKVKPEYASTEEEYKFKSSIERNDVPIQVLIDCPKLIDANTKEEVLAYLEPFMSAIDATESPDVEAFDAGDSDDEIDEMLG